jgi:hypothetical protein
VADLEIRLLTKFSLDFLFLLVTPDALTGGTVSQPLLETLAAIPFYQSREALLFDLSRNQLLNEGDINADPISNSAGTDFMRMKLRHDMNLLFAAMSANSGVAIGRRRGAGIFMVSLQAHGNIISRSSEKYQQPSDIGPNYLSGCS